MENISLIRQLEFLTKGLELKITFKDTSGFLQKVDSHLRITLIYYMLHHNSFCEYIKNGEGLVTKCTGMAEKIKNKCTRIQGGFIGTCHAGVKEYILPVFSDEKELIGFFTVGSFKVDQDIRDTLLKKVCTEGNMSIEQAIKHYEVLSSNIPYSLYLLESTFSFIFDYIRKEYIKTKKLKDTIDVPETFTFEDGILSRAIVYINENYKEKLNVKKIAAICGSSESYMNHSFKTKTDISISAYINWVRITNSLYLLRCDEESITNIALEIGYSDANYYSKVFKSIYGVTPRQYKKKYV